MWKKIVIIIGLLLAQGAAGQEGHSFQITVSDVSINGEGDAVTIPQDTQVKVVFDYQIWNGDSCPLCVSQIVVGIEDTPISCVYSGIPGKHPGVSRKATCIFTPHRDPGTYHLFCAGATQYSCEAALNCYKTTTGLAQEKRVIGTITVKGVPKEEETGKTTVSVGELVVGIVVVGSVAILLRRFSQDERVL